MIVRSKELRTMTDADIQKKLSDVTSELNRQRSKKSSGGAPENAGRMRELRRTVARIRTIMKEKVTRK